MANARFEDAAASFNPLRKKLMRVAYRMLGSVVEAEDNPDGNRLLIIPSPYRSK